ncbi:hypothetical protein [Lacticaseibacillus paracasei]|uniref:hypothetical protein n=1 Tax=Lacticaseibacillus paracasei TaxID=1597 RepID=UPI0026B35A23
MDTKTSSHSSPNLVKFGGNERLQRVFSLIPHGIVKPVTAAQISQISGIPIRRVYDCIQQLVMKYSIPVGGVRHDNQHGYFIITNEQERRAALLPLQSNAKELTRRASVLARLPLSEA